MDRSPPQYQDLFPDFLTHLATPDKCHQRERSEAGSPDSPCRQTTTGQRLVYTDEAVSVPIVIRRAHAVTPLTAVQSEYSMMERIIENLADAELTDQEFKRIEEALSEITIHGNCTDADIARLKNMR